jgi:hypothetical protein
MFETLFGWDPPTPAKFFIAFVAVLALIALTAWVVRRFGANRLGGNTRGRQPRLAVIDAASVDGRRRLVLVRRDNIEHLVMIGGPTDVVIEANIVRAAAARDLNRDTPRVPVAGDTLPRALPMGDAGAWPLQPAHEPPPPPASRPARPPVVDEPWVPANEPGMRARPAEPDHAAKPHADFAPPPPPRQAPPPAPPVARETVAEPAPPPQTDHNLAEMAQRLEAALRRPGATDVHPPVTDPLAMPVKSPAPKVSKPAEPPRAAPEPISPPLTASREPAAPESPRVATRESAIPEAPRAPEREPRAAPPEVKPAAAAAEKNPFDSLEQEMANLLGRPSGKT